ncbi:MAG TPA: hypothetical protein VN461_05475 [Vicinamibacteria bacterium]|nr:hypothetical protein [Vicinamibacteria bacterium]
MTLTRSYRVCVGVLLCLLILAVNVLSVSSRLGFLHKPKQVKELDHLRYIEMARGPEGRPQLAHESTYCWRILVPELARLLNRAGLDLNLAFFLITNASLFGFLLALWAYLGALGFSLPYRLAGLSLVGLTQGAVRWYEYQYWMTDAACLFLMALAFLWIRQGRSRALYVPSVIAAFVRENYVAVYPYYFLHLLKRGASPTRAGARVLALGALPLAIFVGLRILIVPNQPDNFLADIAETTAFRLRHLSDNQPYLLTVGSLGVLFPMLFLFPGRLLQVARRHYDQVAVVAFFYALLLLANNTERELAYTLPVVLPAALRNLGDLVAEARLPTVPLLAGAVVLQGLFFSQQRFAEIGMSMYQPTNLVVVAAMALFWLGAQAALYRRRPRGVPLSSALPEPPPDRPGTK